MIHLKRPEVELLRQMPWCIQQVESRLPISSGIDPLDSWYSDDGWNWCIWLCNCHNSLHYALQWRNPPCGLPFPYTHCPWPSLGHSRQRTPGHLWGFSKMATLSWKFWNFGQCCHWPQKSGILHHNQVINLPTSPMVRIPLPVQYDHLFPPR